MFKPTNKMEWTIKETSDKLAVFFLPPILFFINKTYGVGHARLL